MAPLSQVPYPLSKVSLPPMVLSEIYEFLRLPLRWRSEIVWDLLLCQMSESYLQFKCFSAWSEEAMAHRLFGSSEEEALLRMGPLYIYIYIYIYVFLHF